jgi:hypothetical protein
MASNCNSRFDVFQILKENSPALAVTGMTLRTLLILAFERVHQLGHCLFKLDILRL